MKLWATRETRSELMLACLRVLMGAIFLAVWSDNLIKGYYSRGGWADFVQKYADTTKVGLYADVLNSVMIPNSTVFAYGQFAIEFVVFGLFLVLGLFTPVVGAARRALPAEPAGRDVGHGRVAGHLHHHVPAAGRDQPVAVGPDARSGRAARAEEPAPAAAGVLTAGRAGSGAGGGPGRKPNSPRRSRHHEMSRTA